MPETPHEILGLPDNADIKKIHSAYQELSKQYHKSDANDISAERFNEIQQAYSVLCEKHNQSDSNEKQILLKIAITKKEAKEGTVKQVSLTLLTICKECEGQKTKDGKKCDNCGGVGQIGEKITGEVTIPPTTKNKQKIKLNNLGLPSDVFVEAHVEKK